MAGTVAHLVVKVSASVTEMEKALNSVDKKWARVGGKLQAVGGELTRAVTLPIVAFGGLAVKAASDFESAMTKVRTLAGESAEGLTMLRGAVLKLAPAVGIGPTALAEGLLAIESTGFRGQAALDILEMSAKGSAIGMGETSDVARALTAAVNAYGAENISAARAADILTATVDAGGAEADQLAGELGRVVGVAAQLGISFDQVGAFIATYTKLGLSAAEATTGLSGVLNMILSPSREARNALAEIGMSAEGLRVAVREKGLDEALIGLLGKVKGNGDAVGALFGNVRALAGVMGTAGTQAETYRQVLERIGDSTGTLNERFNIYKKTTAATWASFKASVEVAAIALGDRLAPSFVAMMKAAQPVVDAIVSVVGWFAKLPEPVQTAAVAMVALAAATGPVVYVIGSLMKAGAGAAGLIKMIGASGIGAKVGMAGMASGVTALTGALALIVVPMALERVWTLLSNIVGLVNDQQGHAAGAAGNAATHDRMLDAASKVAGRSVTDVTEGQDILRAHNFALQQKALNKGGFKLETDVTKLMGGTGAAKTGGGTPPPAGAPRQKYEGRLLDTSNLVLDLQREAIDNEMEFAKAMAEVTEKFSSRMDTKPLEDFADAQRIAIDNELAFHDAVIKAFPDSVLDVQPLLDYQDEQLRMIDNELAFGAAMDDITSRTLDNIARMADSFIRLGDTIGGSLGIGIAGIGNIIGAATQYARGGAPKGMMGKVGALADTAGAIWGATQAGGGTGSNVLGGAMSGAATGMAFGPWGAAVGAGVGALVGFVKSRIVGQDEKDARKEFAEWQQDILGMATAAQVAAVSGDKWAGMNLVIADTYNAIGKSTDEALADINNLLDATHVSAEAVQAAAAVINSAFEEHAADQQRLNDAIQRYGFEWEELGAKFQQTTISNNAKELIEDWRVLVASGIDVAMVNAKMAGTMNEFVQSALSVGAEVPLAMQPILQSFADQGLLLDSAGNSITDLQAAGITFSETMAAGFDRVIVKLDQLINSLIAAGTAIDPLSGGLVTQAGGGAAVPAGGSYRDWVEYFEQRDGRASVEDMIQAAKNSVAGLPIPALASGGIVRRPTLAMIGEAGPEAVVPLDGEHSAGGISIGEVHLHGVQNPEQFVEQLKIVTRRNVGGATSYLRNLVVSPA